MQQQFQQPKEKRYDAKKLQHVVELATRLQHEHQETLTATQVEQMGEDLGLSPEFIRKALVLVEEESVLRQVLPPVVQQVYTMPPAAITTTKLAPLSQRTLKQAVLPAALYVLPTVVLTFMVAPLQRVYPNAIPAFLIGLLIFLPLGLALFAGGRQRSRRAGALGGAAVTLAAWLGLVVMSLRSPYVPTNNFDINMQILLACLPAGALLGGVGALLRRWWDSRPVSEEEGRRSV